MTRTAGAALLSCAVVVVGIVGLLGATPSSAASTFSASAGGEITRVGVKLEPGIVFEQLLDPGAMVAQVALDSLGASTGFASDPFPGQVVSQLPSLVDSLTAGQTNVPNLPLIVSSTYPSMQVDRSQTGPLILESQSHGTDTQATATDGASSTIASADVDGSDVVTAKAETSVGTVQAPGGLVQLSGIRSHAQARRSAGGKIERTSDFSVGRLSVLGQSFAITAKGIELLGTSVPLGVDVSSVLKPLLSQVSGRGIGLTILQPVETPDGVVSAGVELTYGVDVPSVGHATVTATFGRTFASVTNRAQAGSGSGGSATNVGVELPAVGSSPTLGSSLAVPGLPGLAASPQFAPGIPGVPSRQPSLISASVADRTRISYIFPVLLLAAGCLGLATSLFRHFGVKLAWTS